MPRYIGSGPWYGVKREFFAYFGTGETGWGRGGNGAILSAQGIAGGPARKGDRGATLWCGGRPETPVHSQGADCRFYAVRDRRTDRPRPGGRPSACADHGAG